MNASGRTTDDLRRLVDAGVLPEDLCARVLGNHRGLSTCWCGYDMGEHNLDTIDDVDAPIQDHGFHACGTKWIAWMLEAAERDVFPGVPFEHVHADPAAEAHGSPVGSFCLLCRVEAWEAAATSEV